MDSIKIYPHILHGTITVPPSKSISHRAIISAGISKGISNISNVIASDDIKATIMGMCKFGMEIYNVTKRNEHIVEKLRVKGSGKIDKISDKINCIESASTLRFLIPLACCDDKEIVFDGKGKLKERPLEVYYNIFDKQNIIYSNNLGRLPLRIKGKLVPGTYTIRGDVSSQFLTGLMFALPLLEGDSKIIVTSALESKGYIDITIDVLRHFFINIENNNYQEFYIKGNQNYLSNNYHIEGDYSQAAFWLAAGTLGGNITCKGLSEASLQPDKKIVDIIKQMNGNIKTIDNTLIVESSKTKGITIDASQIPDLVPIISVIASLSNGTTNIINGKRLRIKESDRLKAVCTELNKLGADVTEKKDGLIIKGKPMLNGGEVDSWNDHRIAMAMAIASIRCKNTVEIKGYNSVRKSYPYFWDDFRKLGGKIIG